MTYEILSAFGVNPVFGFYVLLINDVLEFRINTTGLLFCGCFFLLKILLLGNSQSLVVARTVGVSIKEWHQLVVQFSDCYPYLYLDGALVPSFNVCFSELLFSFLLTFLL